MDQPAKGDNKRRETTQNSASRCLKVIDRFRKLNNGKLEYIPKELVERDERYASEQGNKTLATALEEIKSGRGKEFASVEELIADLDS